MDEMRISIAMATFNGAKFLVNQLESFDVQSRLPDEIVICDDASTDDTVEILELFAAKTNIEVRIFRNEIRLGFVKNFERSIALCTGDIVFLSDQDDVWYPNKIATVVSEFQLHSGTHVCIHDQDIVGSDLAPTHRTTFSNCRRLGLSLNWVVTGCCTAFTREFRDLVLPFPAEIASHDGWIHRLAMLLSVRVMIPSSLQLYRRHEGNASHSLAATNARFPKLQVFLEQGLKKSPASWRREIAISAAASTAIKNRAETIFTGDPEVIEKILTRERLKIDLLNARLRISNLPWLLRGASVVDARRTYMKAYSWKSLVKDLLL